LGGPAFLCWDSPRNSWEYKNSLSPLRSFFFCVPKRRNKKKAPQPVLALRASLTSRRGRDAEKLGLYPQTVGVSATAWLRLPPASFPPPSARRGRTNGEGENSHWHAAKHRRGCRKGDLHCLSAASLQSPGSIEEHRASRLRRDKRHRGPFLWFVSLGKQRNEQSNFMLHSPLICEQTFLPGTASVQ
jgi:hypothetical protein